MAKYKKGDVVIIPVLDDCTLVDTIPKAIKVWPCAAVIDREADENTDYWCLPLVCDMGQFREGGCLIRSEREIAVLDDADGIRRVMKEYWNSLQY